MSTVAVSDSLLIVPKPALPPAYCMASLAYEDPRGFIDTTLTPAVVDPRVYISVSWVEETARKLGMEYTGEFESSKAALEARVEQLEQELAEADKQLQAIDVMESAGFVARQKPARKPAAKKTTKAKAS